MTWCDNDTDDGNDCLVTAVTGDGPTSAANATFLAHARQDIPALIARVRELEHRIAGCEEAEGAPLETVAQAALLINRAQR